MDALEALLALYRPNVSNGNFQADVYGRGWNAGLAKAIVTAGLATMDHVTSEFGRLDRQDTEARTMRLDRLNARARDGA